MFILRNLGSGSQDGFHIASESSFRVVLFSGGQNSFQMVSDALEMVPDSARWLQIAPAGSK